VVETINNPEEKRISFENRCKGCGVCAAACTNEAINMRINRYGEYQPDLKLDRCTNCGRCKTVCPMDVNEIGYNTNIMGGYSKYYVAHSRDKEIRWKCSSGGVVTQILIYLMNIREIEKAVCVGFANADKPYFMPKICRTAEEILECRGSKYYPVEYSNVLEEIKRSEGSCAIVCLPCVATAIKRLKNLDKQYNKIKYVISITCGHNKTMEYIEFILSNYRLEAPLRHISFRNKGNYPFHRYALKAVDLKGKSIKEHFDNGIINNLWSGYYFCQIACLKCPDVFGFDGDLSCMDAWRFPYNNSKNGYNFVIGKEDISNSLIEGNEKLLFKEIGQESVVNSQRVIIERKTKRSIPEDYLNNMGLSEKYAAERDELAKSILHKEIMDRVKQRCKGNLVKYVKDYKSTARQIVDKIRMRFGFYENLIGR